MKRRLSLFIASICLFACHSKQCKITLVPTGDGMEALYGHIKEITTGNEIETHTERDYYSIVDFNKKGDSIKISGSSHGMISITKINAVYGSHGKVSKMIKYHDFEYLGGDPFGNDPAYKKRRNSLAKQVAGVYTCDMGGHVVNYIPESNDVESYIYKYNTEGDMIECDTYIKSIGLKYVSKFTYNSRHLIDEENKFVNKHLMMHVNYSYLEFDSGDNWTKRKGSYDYPSGLAGKETETLTRKITYY
jgi:hypothetical protein